jgi:predicted component of type VI protein secretion system
MSPDTPRLFSLNQRKGTLHQVLHLRGPETFIGRQEGCKIRIPSAEVSRKHCRLAMMNDLLAVEDLGSANGTFINDVRITEQSYLKPGDVLRVGPFRFLVVYSLSDVAIKHLLEYMTGGPPEGYDVEVLDSAILALDSAEEPIPLDPDDIVPSVPVARPVAPATRLDPPPPAFGARQ